MTAKADELDEIFADIYAATFDDEGVTDGLKATRAYIRTQQLELIKKIESEVVGEDELPIYGGDKSDWQEPEYHNQLRAEQRIQLNNIKKEL